MKNFLSFFQKKGHVFGFIYLGILAVGVILLLTGVNPMYLLGINQKETAVAVSPVPSEVSVSPEDSPIESPDDNSDTNANYNSDPVVECGPGVHSGQYLKDNQSNCQNYVDCGFKDGSWKMMTKSACATAQAQDGQSNQSTPSTQQTSSSSNRVPVFIPHLGITDYCPPQNVAAVESLNAQLASTQAQTDADLSTCTQNFVQNSSCFNDCKAQDLNHDPNFDFTACSAKCPSSGDTCDWALATSQRLVAQISDLCK